VSHPPFITAESVAGRLSWPAFVEALDRGHGQAPARIDDVVLKDGGDSLLNRAAWVPGMGLGLKTVTVFPDNPRQSPPLPTVQGVFVLFDAESGAPAAILDGPLITRWKTAADSVLGARYLAVPDPESLLILGAGTVADSLIDAYSAVFPSLRRIAIWNRTEASARTLADSKAAAGYPVTVATDLPSAVGESQIVATATLSTRPILHGDWLAPGTHVDLIGAYRGDMREADDAVLRRGRLFVDSRATTIDHIGELTIPLAAGTIVETDVLGDLYDLKAGRAGRQSPRDISVFKNGGGAHLDVMAATVIEAAYRDAHPLEARQT